MLLSYLTMLQSLRYLPCNHKIVVLAHAFRSFTNLAFIICNDLYPLEADAERKAVLGKVCRIGINCLQGRS